MKLPLVLELRTTRHSLPLEITVDGLSQISNITTQGISICAEIDDSAQVQHVLQMKLTDKQEEHTIVGDNGEIIEDRMIELVSLRIDCFDLTKLFSKQAVYEHDNNHQTDPIKDIFCGYMGCNGTVTWQWTSPCFHWLLYHVGC